ncbi:hypothetical protein [Pulveribacter sp.]|uniref:hypothetical protein n=1 Tax=Pulveribacter sp. TaxID=2678893 RepID=UPI00289D5799|nr:hypothetical protein [Pulveribacter sp.]
MSPATPPPPRKDAAPPPPPTVRDEKRIKRYVAILLVVVVLAVLAFNMMAPRDRLRAPDEAGTPAATEQRQQPATTAPGDGTSQRVTPEGTDSPTPAGREGMGAPAGAAPTTR